MQTIAQKMKQILHNGEALDKFGGLLHEEWMYKKSLASGITNDKINEYYKRALSAGASGGKIGGAGGGGFLLLYCEQQKQQGVRDELQELREVRFSFEPQGSKIIYIG